MSIFNIDLADHVIKHQLTTYRRCVRSVIVLIVPSLKFQLSLTVSYSYLPSLLTKIAHQLLSRVHWSVLEPSAFVRGLWTCWETGLPGAICFIRRIIIILYLTCYSSWFPLTKTGLKLWRHCFGRKRVGIKL